MWKCWSCEVTDYRCVVGCFSCSQLQVSGSQHHREQAFFRHCHQFFILFSILCQKHNRPLAECFYTKCLTGSCVHTFLTGATGIAPNPCSVRARLCPQICTVQFLPFKRCIKSCYFCLWRNIAALEKRLGRLCHWLIVHIQFVFLSSFSRANVTKRKEEMKTKQKRWIRTSHDLPGAIKEGVCFFIGRYKKTKPCTRFTKKKTKNPLLNQEYKLPVMKLHLQSL